MEKAGLASGAAASEVKLLIVDDHDGVRGAVRDWLTATYPGLRIREVCDGEEAVRVCARAHFDIVLMDIGLPGISGIEAARRLRVVAPDTRIVMISVHDSDAQRAASIAAGAVAFVAKRRMHQGLRATMSHLLAARGARRPAA